MGSAKRRVDDSKEAKMVTITEIANSMGMRPDTARAKLRKEFGKKRWMFKKDEIPMIKRVIT